MAIIIIRTVQHCRTASQCAGLDWPSLGHLANLPHRRYEAPGMIHTAMSRRSLLPAAAAFAAVPAQARAPSLDFVVIGDWGRNGQSHQRDVAQQMGRSAASI